MTDDLSTALAEIREHHRQHVSANYPAPGICVSRCPERWPCGPARAVAAVDAVLKAAAGWQRYAARGDAQDECAREARKVILAALTGEAGHA